MVDLLIIIADSGTNDSFDYSAISNSWNDVVYTDNNCSFIPSPSNGNTANAAKPSADSNRNISHTFIMAPTFTTLNSDVVGPYLTELCLQTKL